MSTVKPDKAAAALGCTRPAEVQLRADKPPQVFLPDGKCQGKGELGGRNPGLQTGRDFIRTPSQS